MIRKKHFIAGIIMAGGVSMMTHAFDIGFGRGVVLGAILFAFGALRIQ